jgi:hypothetical protein
MTCNRVHPDLHSDPYMAPFAVCNTRPDREAVHVSGHRQLCTAVDKHLINPLDFKYIQI